jgi:hypothetical protein
MLNYSEIDRLFGTPLEYVPRPKTQEGISFWKILVLGTVCYFAYKGIVRSVQEKSVKVKLKTPV